MNRALCFPDQKTIPDLSTSKHASPLPQKIGPYAIESLLSRGGMSLLYLGLHPITKEPLAIKVLVPKFFKNKELSARFLKEAEIIRMSNHPNIIKLYGQGEWEKGLYIAMEFVRGVSLRQFVRQKSLSQKRALEILLQVAYALSHLHSHRVIHRDLKPENILITESGDIKVIDFGISQFEGESLLEKNISQVMGTPVYMSPELREKIEPITLSADIYSLGVIGYELILGNPSHGTLYLKALPKTLRPIIEKMVHPNPFQRYLDVIDCISDLSRALQEIDTQKTESGSEEEIQFIEKGQTLLLPKRAPRWAEIDIGIAKEEGISFQARSLDFFRLPENRYVIFFSEPMVSGAEGFLYSATLRGMLRMAVESHFQQNKKEPQLLAFIETIHQLLIEDPMKQSFKMSCLLLDRERNLLTFIGSKDNFLIHIPEASRKIRPLTTPNPLLGKEGAISFLQTGAHWQKGDGLILTQHIPPEGENLLLSPQNLAETLFQKQPNNAIVVTLQRVF